MPHPENLIPAKKGEIRNPKGKGKGVRNRDTILKELIALNIKFKNPLSGIEETKVTEVMMNYALLAKALAGDVQAIKEINDTLYGKIVEKKDITSDGEKINITFVKE